MITSKADYEDEFAEVSPAYATRTPSKRSKAFEAAHSIRQFEIELYWKRATYFWALIASAFVGFGVVAGSSSSKFVVEQSLLLVLFACLGLCLSFSWFCINKGSKFWQENWELHIDLLEQPTTGPLYKTILLKKREQGLKGITSAIPISVSRVNILVSLLVTLFWIILILISAFPAHHSTDIDWWKVSVI